MTPCCEGESYERLGLSLSAGGNFSAVGERQDFQRVPLQSLRVSAFLIRYGQNGVSQADASPLDVVIVELSCDLRPSPIKRFSDHGHGRCVKNGSLDELACFHVALPGLF